MVGASIFLVAALAGVGGGPSRPTGVPALVILAGPSFGNANPPGGGGLSPAVPVPSSATSPTSLTDVVAVGRSVLQKSLNELASTPPNTAGTGSQNLAAGGQLPASQLNVDASVSPLRGATPASSPTEPSSGEDSPWPEAGNPPPPLIILPSYNPSLHPPVPTPKPTPTPLPTIPHVTGTATPPVTSTSTPEPSSLTPTPRPHRNRGDETSGFEGCECGTEA